MPYLPANPALQNMIPNQGMVPPGSMMPGMYPGAMNQGAIPGTMYHGGIPGTMAAPTANQMPTMTQNPNNALGANRPGYNYFNPAGGGGAYYSKEGLLGGGNPMGGGGQNYFNPYGGGGAYSSGAGLLGGGNPFGGGGYGGGGEMGGGLGSPLGGLISALGGIFGGGGWSNPADAAMEYLKKIPGTITPYFDPYINAGHSALNSLMGQYGNLIGDPGSVMSMLGKGFQQSPGYQFQVNQAGDAANRAAAAGGMLGSPQEQQQVANTVNQLANQDYYNYLNQAKGLYGMGLQGLGGINQMGYGASTQLADMLANIMGQEAQYGFSGQDLENQRNAARNASLWNAIGGLF